MYVLHDSLLLFCFQSSVKAKALLAAIEAHSQAAVEVSCVVSLRYLGGGGGGGSIYLPLL